MELDIATGNPCSVHRDACKNCHNHYAQIRPHITGVVVSHHFLKDMGDETEAKSIMEHILQCSHLQFTELHKFEKHIDEYVLFRAKIDNVHIVYVVDKEKKVILFLRSFKNYSRYKRFLNDEKEIVQVISRSV
ncbi:MAG: hypothetical protein HXS47_06615 [Theionarchaea archaeon]|nr:hypothetical protein [Theionarchaea archaeon]